MASFNNVFIYYIFREKLILTIEKTKKTQSINLKKKDDSITMKQNMKITVIFT